MGSEMIKYELLLACFRSGQMSEAEMIEHMRNDEAFASYAKTKLFR